jgi:hypothetical protein
MLELTLLLPHACSWPFDSFQTEINLIIPFKSFPDHHLSVICHWIVYMYVMIYLLTANGLSPTQKQYIEKHSERENTEQNIHKNKNT